MHSVIWYRVEQKKIKAKDQVGLFVLASTRTVYENKLQQLMKQCPGAAAGEKSQKVDCESENVGAKGNA